MALQIAALALLGVGFEGARQAATVPQQEGWMILAVVAAVISGLGNGWALIVGRGRVARRRRRLLGGDELVQRPVRPTLAGGALVAGPDMTLYHRAHCTLVVGKPVSVESRDSHEQSRRRPCEWCCP